MGSLSFLIIDEDRRTRSMLIRAIQRKFEAHVEGYENVLAAESRATRSHWSGILVDTGLSVVSARDTRLRIAPGGALTAGFIACVCREDDLPVAVDHLRAGFDGLVTRPFSADLIFQKLRMLMTSGSGMQTAPEIPPAEILPMVLLADGNERYRQALASLLADRYAVLESVTGLDALATCLHRRPAHVILSPSIDGLSGERILQTIRKAPEAPRVFVTMFEPSEEDADALRGTGAAGVLRRTTDRATLHEQLVRSGILPSDAPGSGR